ncbi:MAG: imelysin family protein [Polyangiaceae bacterium]
MKVIISITPRALFASATLALAAALTGCGSDPEPADPTPVVERYVEMVHDTYEDTVFGVTTLKGTVDDLTATPSEASLKAARDAWIAARPSYGESESYRFYGGPIDDEDGPEGRINAWPLDEAFIDYVEGAPEVGIINQLQSFPDITKDILISQNEKGGEKNIATGYHAVEFLLWGQDQSTTGPGARPYTDYVTDGTGTAENQDRRAQYLTLVTDILLEDLISVEVQWEPGADNYAASFAKDPKDALGKMLKGMGSLSGAELSRERMNNALQEQDQEEEHSCFSDNTHADLVANATAVQNVYLGRYGGEDGPGIDDLVAATNPDLDAQVKADLDAVLGAIDAIPQPFDQAIVSEDGRAKIQAAIDALQKVTDDIVLVAAELEVTINLEE